MGLIYKSYIQKVNCEILMNLDFDLDKTSDEALGNLLIYYIEDGRQSNNYKNKLKIETIKEVLISRIENNNILTYSLFNGYAFVLSALSFYLRNFQDKNFEARLHTTISASSTLFELENLNNDLESGRAGLIVAFIDLYKVTEDLYYLYLADKILEKLLTDIKFYKKGIFWLTHHNYIKPIIGLNKGNIGINFSLVKHFSVSKNKQLRAVVNKSNQYLLSQFKLYKNKSPNFEVIIDSQTIRDKDYEKLLEKTEIPNLNDLSLSSGFSGILLNSIFTSQINPDLDSLKELKKQNLLLVKSIPAAINERNSLSLLKRLNGFVLPLILARDISGIKNAQPINLLLQKGLEIIESKVLNAEKDQLESLNALLQFSQMLYLADKLPDCYLYKLYNCEIERIDKESKLSIINSKGQSVFYLILKSVFPRINEYIGDKKLKEIVHQFIIQSNVLDYRKFLGFLKEQKFEPEQKNLRHLIRYYYTSFNVVNNCENFFHKNLLSKYRYHLYKAFLAGKDNHYSNIKLTLNPQMFSVITNVPLSNIGYVRASEGNLDAYLDKLRNRGNKIFLCYFAVSLFSKEILTDLRDYANQEQFILLNYYNGQYRTLNDAILFIKANFPEIFNSESDVETIIEEFILLSLRVGILEYEDISMIIPTTDTLINSINNFISI